MRFIPQQVAPKKKTLRGTLYSSSVQICYLSDEVSQAWVTQQQPAARSDTIGLVLELLWLHLIEVLETEDGETYNNNISGTQQVR